jgi:sulfide dehydrogenase cytochrome subunit
MTNIQIWAVFTALSSAWFAFAGVAETQQIPPDSAAICAGCHGEGGVSSNPFVPTLAGQPYSLIEDNLLAFRAGQRSCAQERNDGSPAALLATTMCSTVARLSDQEISGLAAYFEQQEFEPANQVFDPGLAKSGAALHFELGCEECHSDGGRVTNAMAPVLAGQWTPYLDRAMRAVRSGVKPAPDMMASSIRKLEDDEVEALLNYYASATGGSQ